MRLTDQELLEVALTIRPKITPFIEGRGVVSDEEVRLLAKRHSRHAIVSERSVTLVQQYLAEI